MIVMATPMELLRVAQGHPMMFAGPDGTRVCVAVPTVDEYLAALERDRPGLEARGLPLPPLPSRREVERVVAPLRLATGL